MKKIYLLCLIINIIPLYSQVGIGTTMPTAELDINGNLRVRSTTSTSRISAAKDSILVSDHSGNVMRIAAKTIIESHIKTFVKGSFVSSSDVSLVLASGSRKIPFDYEEFDTNNDFNTTTSTFTAPQNGIYSIAVNIKAASGLSISSEFGVAVLKNGVVINRQSFLNVGILGINATPPVRTVQTLVSLNAGDTISFNVTSTILTLSVGLIGTKEDSFFTIHQIR
jgi:hypothetical protein